MYQNYIKAKNLAMQVLTDCNITTLPVNLVDIADHYNIILIPYSISEYIKAYNLYNTEGFSFYRNGESIIYFNDNRHTSKIRFTVAHEIGHCLLGHIRNSKKSGKYNYRSYKKITETQANIFAIHLLRR